MSGNPEIILVWPNGRALPEPTPVAGYSVRPLPSDSDSWWIEIQQRAVPRYKAADLRNWLARYRRLALSNGILVAVDDETQAAVATAGSLTSPRDGLFQNGGEIGWVATIPEHRQRGLAYWLCSLATLRLQAHGFRTIFLTTGADMPAALRVYLRLGYLPYIYEPSQLSRWNQICQDIQYPFEPEQWFTPQDFTV